MMNDFFRHLNFLIVALLKTNACFILLLAISGCSSTHQEKPPELSKAISTIDVEASIDSVCKIDVTEIAEEIRYVLLETKANYLINKARQIQITRSFIFVSDKDKLIQFTRNGKFIKQIGRQGRGPGEYSSIMHFAVNEESNLILVQGEYKIIKFTLSGDFSGSQAKSPGEMFMFLNPQHIAFYRYSDIDDPINLVVTDQSLNPIFEFQNYHPRIPTKTKFSTAPMYIWANELYFKENFNDTIFCVKDSLLEPHLIVKEKKLLFSPDFDLQSSGKIADLIDQLEKVKDKLINKSFFESKKYLFISYLKGFNPREVHYVRLLYDKANNETKVLSDGEFINNFDGGKTFWPVTVFQDNILVGSIEAFELKAYIESDTFKNATPKYPEKKKELEKLANSLSENDNPVLMLVKLKE